MLVIHQLFVAFYLNLLYIMFIVLTLTFSQVASKVMRFQICINNNAMLSYVWGFNLKATLLISGIIRKLNTALRHSYVTTFAGSWEANLQQQAYAATSQQLEFLLLPLGC